MASAIAGVDPSKRTGRKVRMAVQSSIASRAMPPPIGRPELADHWTNDRASTPHRTTNTNCWNGSSASEGSILVGTSGWTEVRPRSFGSEGRKGRETPSASTLPGARTTAKARRNRVDGAGSAGVNDGRNALTSTASSDCSLHLSSPFERRPPIRTGGPGRGGRTTALPCPG